MVLVKAAARPTPPKYAQAHETELHLAVETFHVLAPRNVFNWHATPWTQSDAWDRHRHLISIPTSQQHLFPLLQQGLVLAEAALLIAAVDVVLGVPGPEAEEAEVAIFAVLVRTFDFVTTAFLYNGNAAPWTLLAETHQPVLIELICKEGILLSGESAQLAAEGVVPLLAAPLKGTEDLPPPLLGHALQQRDDRLSSHKVPARHLGHSLFQRDLVLQLAHELDVRDLSQGDLGLCDDVLEGEQTADALLVSNAPPLLLQDHLLWQEGLRNALEDKFLQELAGDGGVDVNVLHLSVGQSQQDQRDAGREGVTLLHHRQHDWLVLLVPHKNYYYTMQIQEQNPPVFIIGIQQAISLTITVLLPAQAAQLLPANLLAEFQEKERVSIPNHIFITAKQGRKYTIEQSCNLQFTKGVQALPYYLGLASGLLASAYSYSTKTVTPPSITVALYPHSQHALKITSLANARVKSAILASGRGDHFGSPAYFIQRSKHLAEELGLGMTAISGQELRKEGLNLFHAVGRASNKDPALINISYRGDSSSEDWLALIGKGICFDSGGLDLKRTGHNIESMFLDKSGACSCLAAIQFIAREKLPINVTATLGMAQNFISKRSYRPGDIITSRKGLTVQIADTDAQGRLVLADSMTWTQARYRVTRMVELSTLTYSIIVGLGSEMAGIFGNSPHFSELLRQCGEEVLQRGWIMPLEESHQEFLVSKGADLLSDANDTAPGAAIAAAFLQNFVEEGVEWIHLDVAGPCVKLEERIGTGYGARLLLQLARSLTAK